MTERNFASIESAIEKIAAGGMVIVVDDETRENEGDFICAAEKITPEMVNFMLQNNSFKTGYRFLDFLPQSVISIKCNGS